MAFNILVSERMFRTPERFQDWSPTQTPAATRPGGASSLRPILPTPHSVEKSFYELSPEVRLPSSPSFPSQVRERISSEVVVDHTIGDRFRDGGRDEAAKDSFGQCRRGDGETHRWADGDV